MGKVSGGRKLRKERPAQGLPGLPVARPVEATWTRTDILDRAGGGGRPDESSKTEVQAEGITDLVHDAWRYSPYTGVKAFNRDRPNLFRLGLRVARQAARASGQPDLEWIDLAHVARDWHHGHDSALQCRYALVGAVVTHDHRWSPVCCLSADGDAEIHHPDVAAAHRLCHAQSFNPSPDDRSHALVSSSSSHSAHAAA